MLLLQNVEPVELVVLTVSAVAGVITLAGSFEGWFYRDLKKYERVIFGILALLAIYHDFWVSVIATAAIGAVMFYFRMGRDKDGAEPNVETA